MTLEVLSPIHIGIGEILSPYSDYIYKNGFVHYINQEVLASDLEDREDGEQILDQYVEFIKTNFHQPGRYKLIDFFEEHSLDIEKYSKKHIPVTGVLNSEEIQRTMITGNVPYIPGSTLKGAIRTCILYGHLKEEGYKLQDLLNVKKTYIGQNIFGYYDKDMLKYLHISDTIPLSVESLQILKTVRWDLLKDVSTIPIVREVIPINSRYEIQIQSKGTAQDRIQQNFSYLYKGNEADILTKINDFYFDVLQEEINVLTSYGRKEFEHVLSFYRDLQKECLELKERKNGAILRVGAGKAFFENTVSLCLDTSDRQQILKRVKGGNSKVFPKTRTVIIEREVIVGVLGWVRLQAI